MSGKKTAAKSKPTKTASKGTAADNVEQIREIIFGGQMRDYETRFEALSQHLRDSAQNLRDDFDLKLVALDKALAKQSDSNSDRFKQESSDRASDIDQLRQDVAQLRNDNDGRLGGLDDLIEKETRTLLSEVHETRNDLLNRLNEQVDALQARLDEENRHMDERKVGREELAGLLNEVAMRLTGESPGK